MKGLDECKTLDDVEKFIERITANDTFRGKSLPVSQLRQIAITRGILLDPERGQGLLDRYGKESKSCVVEANARFARACLDMSRSVATGDLGLGCSAELVFTEMEAGFGSPWSLGALVQECRHFYRSSPCLRFVRMARTNLELFDGDCICRRPDRKTMITTTDHWTRTLARVRHPTTNYGWVASAYVEDTKEGTADLKMCVCSPVPLLSVFSLRIRHATAMCGLFASLHDTQNAGVHQRFDCATRMLTFCHALRLIQLRLPDLVSETVLSSETRMMESFQKCAKAIAVIDPDRKLVLYKAPHSSTLEIKLRQEACATENGNGNTNRTHTHGPHTETLGSVQTRVPGRDSAPSLFSLQANLL
jgi:hypothetical protein